MQLIKIATKKSNSPDPLYISIVRENTIYNTISAHIAKHKLREGRNASHIPTKYLILIENHCSHHTHYNRTDLIFSLKF